MRNKVALNLAIACFLVFIAVLGYFAPEDRVPVWSGRQAMSLDLCDHEVGRYITVVDERGTVITKTSRQVFPGDEIITARAEHYRVMRVEHNVAVARLQGLDKELLAWKDYFGRYGDTLTVPAQGGTNIDVAIYHSHTMESYVPDSGAAFQENGDIIKVGRRFAQELRRQGLTVFHDTTNHNPHDAQAYERSRRTAVQLVEKRRPSVLIDLHRDGVPDPDFFRKEIAGQTVSQVRLVVGQQNPKQDANKDFARRMMARANERHPELVKEIFMASGNYNQDLTSTAILIEAGTHTNSRDEVESGLAFLAESMPVVLGVGPAGPDQAGGLVGWRVALALFLVVLGGLAVYLVVSAGGIPQAREKLQQFFNREFGGPGKLLKLKERRDDQDKPEP
jgi:stage II sporulation protein P